MTTHTLTLTHEDIATLRTCLFLAGSTAKTRGNALLSLQIAQCEQRYNDAIAKGERNE